MIIMILIGKKILPSVSVVLEEQKLLQGAIDREHD